MSPGRGTQIRNTHTCRSQNNKSNLPAAWPCRFPPSEFIGDFIEEDDGEYGADLGEEDDFFNGGADASLAGKKRKGEGGGKGTRGWSVFDSWNHRGWWVGGWTGGTPASQARDGGT